jgi:hypothetical protein
VLHQHDMLFHTIKLPDISSRLGKALKGCSLPKVYWFVSSTANPKATTLPLDSAIEPQ